MTTRREEAIARLGAPVCARCGLMGSAQALVQGRQVKDGPLVVGLECCSAGCAVKVLDTMYDGLARIAGKKRGGVIASKQRGHRTGVWPRGRKRLGVEKRKADRDA